MSEIKKRPFVGVGVAVLREGKVLLGKRKCEGWEWFSWDQLPTPLFSSIGSLMAKEGVNILEKYLIHSQIR